MTWKPTIEQVQTITRKTVVQEDIDSAVTTIEGFAGVFEDVTRPNMTERDIRCLRNMTAYQAAWAADQPDLMTRSDVKAVSQDGNSVEFKSDALILAPNAKLWLKRLSWKGTRSIHTPGVTEGRLLNEDDRLDWKPLV